MGLEPATAAVMITLSMTEATCQIGFSRWPGKYVFMATGRTGAMEQSGPSTTDGHLVHCSASSRRDCPT